MRAALIEVESVCLVRLYRASNETTVGIHCHPGPYPL